MNLSQLSQFLCRLILSSGDLFLYLQNSDFLIDMRTIEPEGWSVE
jgi:hypothetical protein